MSFQILKHGLSNLHDGAELEGLQKGEVGGVRETRPENTVVNHRKVQRRSQQHFIAIAPGKRRRPLHRRHHFRGSAIFFFCQETHLRIYQMIETERDLEFSKGRSLGFDEWSEGGDVVRMYLQPAKKMVYASSVVGFIRVRTRKRAL